MAAATRASSHWTGSVFAVLFCIWTFHWVCNAQDSTESVNSTEVSEKVEYDNATVSSAVEVTSAQEVTLRRGYARLAFNNCGDEMDPIYMTRLDVEPNPVQIPGPLTVHIGFRVNENITTPLQVSIEMQKKLSLLFGLSTWLRIPCLPNGVGSCTYDDLCDVGPFAESTCINPETNEEYHCSCPFSEGEYMLKPATFQIPELPNDLPNYLLEGEFLVKVVIEREEEQIACYSTYVELNL